MCNFLLVIHCRQLARTLRHLTARPSSLPCSTTLETFLATAVTKPSSVKSLEVRIWFSSWQKWESPWTKTRRGSTYTPIRRVNGLPRKSEHCNVRRAKTVLMKIIGVLKNSWPDSQHKNSSRMCWGRVPSSGWERQNGTAYIDIIIVTYAKIEFMRSVRFVCHSISVCVQNYWKSNQPISLTRCYDWV